MDKIPLIIYDMSVVDEFMRTFNERGIKEGIINEIAYSSVVPAMDNKHLIYTTDSVFNFAHQQRYKGQSYKLDNIFEPTKKESTYPVDDLSESVFTLLATKSLEVRPVKFLTLDPYQIKIYHQKKTKYALITPDEALKIIEESKKLMYP